MPLTYHPPALFATIKAIFQRLKHLSSFILIAQNMKLCTNPVLRSVFASQLYVVAFRNTAIWLQAIA
jgi:hypothetical protein